MERMRMMVFAVLMLGMAGTLGELLLTSHTEDFRQWAPVALLGLAMPAVALAAIRPAPWSVALTRVLMVLFIAAGLLGTWFHYESNAEFAVELSPGLSGFALMAEALTRPTPPPLAPGTMIMLGLLGLIGCYGILKADN
jgi:hypothetical protein